MRGGRRTFRLALATFGLTAIAAPAVFAHQGIARYDMDDALTLEGLVDEWGRQSLGEWLQRKL